MPLNKSHHKKKTGYRLRKWLNKTLVALNLKKRRFQKPSTDIVFLTTKEVKESLSKAAEHEPVISLSDSTARPDRGILPQKNRSRKKMPNEISLFTRFKRRLKKIFLVVLNNEDASPAHHRRSRRRTHEPAASLPDSATRPDPGILPAKNRSRKKLENELSFFSRLKLFLKRSTSANSEKEDLATAHRRRSRHRVHHNTADAEARFQKINDLRRTKEEHSSDSTSPNKDQRHHHHRRHIHRSRFRKWKSFLMRKLHITRETSGFIVPVDLKIEHRATTPGNKTPWTDYIKPALTSTAMFLVAYQLSWFFYQLVVMITASMFGIDSVLYFYEVMFPVGSNALIWTPEKIIIVTLSGPFTALLIWILLRFVLRLKSRYGSHMRMFLVWMYLMSMMMFFGAFVGGAITLEGFGYVIDWLFMSVALRLILSMIFISLIIALSWKVVSYLPETTRTNSWKNNRHFFVLSRLVIPWVLGSGIMTLLKLTDNITQHANIFDYDTINLVTLAFAVIPPVFNAVTRPQLNRRRKVNQKLRDSLPLIWVSAAIVIVVLFRVILSFGIYFKLILNLKMNFYN